MTQHAAICTPKFLPRDKLVDAAARARQINPINHPPAERLMGIVRGFRPSPMRIAVLTTKYWGPAGVRLTVGFLDNPPRDLRAHILAHLNAWSKTANVIFTESRSEPQVRIARAGGRDGGYWSYVGTDILSIPDDEPTMNLEDFTMNTPESEFFRVIRHEAGHTLGFPHEHMRRQLVNRIDRRKAITYFGRTQGWTPEEVKQQVLTPIEESALIATRRADQASIMCYQIPGFLTKSGKPILGGTDIDALDAEFAGTVYPKPKKTIPRPTGSKPKSRKSKRHKPTARKATAKKATARKSSRKAASRTHKSR